MIDPTRFHLQTLPQSPRLGQAARSIGANRSFGLRLRDAQGGEQAWTYASDGEAMQIREGVRGADVVVAMSVEAFDSPAEPVAAGRGKNRRQVMTDSTY